VFAVTHIMNRSAPVLTSARRVALVSALAGALASVGCSNPNALSADVPVTTDTLVLFSMTGTPVGYPAALNTSTRGLVRIDPSFAFDIAFDIDAQANAKLVPVRLMGGTATASRVVGLQKITAGFDASTLAPTGGYQYDSVLVLKPGESAFVQVQSTQCALLIQQNLYSKLAIDSVRPATKTIYFRLVHDPNCGFRSLGPGIPKR
jgi:hypothetical protein